MTRRSGGAGSTNRDAIQNASATSASTGTPMTSASRHDTLPSHFALTCTAPPQDR